jgi:hypothetical protein
MTDFGLCFSGIVGNGKISIPGIKASDMLIVSATENPYEISFSAGFIWFNGAWCYVDEAEVVTIDNANSSLALVGRYTISGRSLLPVIDTQANINPTTDLKLATFNKDGNGAIINIVNFNPIATNGGISDIIKTTLTPDGWIDGKYRITHGSIFEDTSAEECVIDVDAQPGANASQRLAIYTAIGGAEQHNGYMDLILSGDVPTLDLPVQFYVSRASVTEV